MKAKTDESKTSSAGKPERYRITLTGRGLFCFQRFVREGDTTPAEYLYQDDGGFLYLPADNLLSFYTNESSGTGCATTFTATGKKAEMTRLAKSYLHIEPEFIYFTREGRRIHFGGFPSDAHLAKDPESGLIVIHKKAIVRKRKEKIPQIRKRPFLDEPWSLEFFLVLFPCAELQFSVIENWTVRGGAEICLGGMRPYCGKFTPEFMRLAE